MDPGRYRSGRWLLLTEGALVCAFGIAGLVSAVLHPHAGPTGAPILGLASAPPHSAMLLALGLIAIGAAGNRRAAVTVTALSAVAYTMLLFFSSVATARARPTPLGFHAADIVLHGVLAVVNLALLMWLIPDELGDEAWVPRRRRRPSRHGRHSPAADAGGEVTAVSVGASSPAKSGRPTAPEERSGGGQVNQAESSDPPVGAPTARRARLEQPSSEEVNDPLEPFADRAANGLLSREVVFVSLAVLAVVVGIVWLRRRR